MNWNLKDWDQKLCLYEDVLTFFPINQDLCIAGKAPSEHLEVFSLKCRDRALWVHRDSFSHETAKSPQIPRASIMLSSDNYCILWGLKIGHPKSWFTENYDFSVTPLQGADLPFSLSGSTGTISQTLPFHSWEIWGAEEAQSPLETIYCCKATTYWADPTVIKGWITSMGCSSFQYWAASTKSHTESLKWWM